MFQLHPCLWSPKFEAGALLENEESCVHSVRYRPPPPCPLLGQQLGGRAVHDSQSKAGSVAVLIPLTTRFLLWALGGPGTQPLQPPYVILCKRGISTSLQWLA